MVDKPYNIPENWEWSLLGNVSQKPQYGWTTKASQEGNIHLLRTTDITSGIIDWGTVPFCTKEPDDIDKYLIRDGDIVISRAGSVGYSYLINKPSESVFASYLIRFKPLINEKYFHFFLQTPLYWNSISEQKLGIAVPNVNATKLSNIPIPIAPLNEQVRIVSKIEKLFSRLDQGVNALQQTQQQLEQYRKSTLQQAFTGRLTQKWRIQEYGKDYNWDHSQFIEHIHVEMGQSPPGTSYNSEKVGLPLLNGPTEFRDKYPLPIQWTTESKKECRKDDLLICVRGHTTGRMNWADQKYSIGRGVATLRKKINEINMNFIYYYLILKQTEILNRTSGSTFPNLRKREINNFGINMPKIKEQNMIVNILDKIYSITNNIQNDTKNLLQKVQIIKHSILKKAFEGRLVPQAPDDEPASVLLDRIKAENVKIKPNNRRKHQRKDKGDFVFKLTPVKKSSKRRSRS